MPYLSTSQAYLEQSCLLLEAYPNTTRITTKYSFPSQRPSKSKPTETENADTPQQTPQPPIATLTLKTYDPVSGVCLKYCTNKAAEVGRLITSLGKLAAGANVASLGLSSAGPAAAMTAAGDVEMAEAPAPTEEIAAATATATTATPAPKGGSGKSKKKGGKGKR